MTGSTRRASPRVARAPRVSGDPATSPGQHDVLDDLDGPQRVARLLPHAGQRTARTRGALLGEPRVDVLAAGAVGKPLSLGVKALTALLRRALAVSDAAPSVVWVRGDDELAVHSATLRVALGSGSVVVGVGVECDETGPVEVVVPFALGSPELQAGLLMASPARPDGPALVVAEWGGVLVAAVYRALLDVVTAVAATAGVDEDGAPLLPGAVACDGRALTVIPQARHAIDRRALR